MDKLEKAEKRMLAEVRRTYIEVVTAYKNHTGCETSKAAQQFRPNVLDAIERELRTAEIEMAMRDIGLTEQDAAKILASAKK